MEQKHMSAFALYQMFPTTNGPSPAEKPPLPVNSRKKKRKRNITAPAPKPNRTIKAERKSATMKTRKKKIHNVSNDDSSMKKTNGGAERKAGLLEDLLSDLKNVNNSMKRAGRLFQWLIDPLPAPLFFRDTWEKKPIFVQRSRPDYYKGLFSTDEMDRILREETVEYGVNLDVTSYTNGSRQTHNPPGRARPFGVWGFYQSGCSLRLLNPQSFSSSVWNVLSILQEFFGSMVGANVYLTPPQTQGFAPHYDDIEAFVVQLEGKKHWRVYNPRSEDEVLPVLSSANFSQSDIGKPLLDVVLEAGDLLYFPRGFIHQGNCLADAHSLHITISSYQKNSWGDLLQKLVPAALEIAMEEDVDYRRGLPLDYLTYMGVQNSDKDDPRRATFFSRIETLVKRLSTYAPVDAAVDQKARDFLHDCLPPMLTADELAGSVQGAPVRWETGRVQDADPNITTQTRVRILRAGCARLCSDGGAVHLFYTTNNSRVYHKEEPHSLEVKAEHTEAVELLIHSYPDFVTVETLPCESVQDRIALTEVLFENGILQTEGRLQ